MKYKINKGNELYDKIYTMWQHCKWVNGEAKKLAHKVGAENAYSYNHHRAGGIDAFRFDYDKTPPQELWMQPDRHKNPRMFFPRSGKKYKQNEGLLNEIRSLPVVTWDDFNSVIGFESQWKGVTHYTSYGVSIGSELILIEIGENCSYTSLPEMEEITVSEYVKLKALIPD